jgi:hypothetical protein
VHNEKKIREPCSMINILFSVLFGAALFQGESDGATMKLAYYHHGKKSDLHLSRAEQSKLLALVSELFDGANDMLRVYVDDERMDGLRKKETCLEIFLRSTLTLTSREGRTYVVRKIFIPLSGDFVGTEKEPLATIILGDDGYLSGPLNNPAGSPILRTIQELIKRSGPKQ